MINPMAMLQQLMSNPVQTLMQAKFSVPDGMNNPNEIIQHLLNTGQVSQQRVDQAMAMRNNPMIRQMFSQKM